MPVILHGNPTKRARRPLAASWRLAAGHYIPAKMTPLIIGPSPNTTAETDAAWSRYRRCPAGIAYRIPISVLGGAWPFYYELTTAPSGMTIGAQYGDTDYGILSWSNPTVGTHSITAQVTDQDGTVVTRSWDLECIASDNTTYFLFFDSATGSNSNSGTPASPKQTFAALAGNQGKQCFYSAGTYHINVLTPESPTQPWYPLVAASMPFVHVGTEAGVIFDFDNEGCFSTNPDDDLCISGIEHRNYWFYVDGLSKYRTTCYRIEGNESGGARRWLQFENRFVQSGGLGEEGTNPSPIFIDSRNALSTYGVIHSCVIDDVTPEYLEVYGTSYCVFENNTIRASDTTVKSMPGVFLKSGGWDHWSIRANNGYGSSVGFMVGAGASGAEPYRTCEYLEICWNSFRSVNEAPMRFANYSLDVTGGNIYVYRNSFSGVPNTAGGRPGIMHVNFTDRNTDPLVAYEKNIIQGVPLVEDTRDPQVITLTNDSTTQTDVTGWLNATTNLIEGDGLTYRGTHGAEVV